MQNKKAKLSPNRLVTVNIISLNSPNKRQRHPIKNKKQTKTPALCCLWNGPGTHKGWKWKDGKSKHHINRKDVVIAILSDKIKFIGKSISRIKGEIN